MAEPAPTYDEIASSLNIAARLDRADAPAVPRLRQEWECERQERRGGRSIDEAIAELLTGRG